jgi:hypothetical protein
MNAKSLYGRVEEENLCEAAKMNKYSDAKPKVLFVLKEPSTRKGPSTRSDNQNYNFKESLEDKGWHPNKMWRLLACCSEGFCSIGQNKNENQVYKWKDSNKCRELLEYSSYMNLKRFGAGTSSDMSLIGLHAGLFWPLMMDEIKELKPDIIVFCGTFTIFEELIECLNKLPEYTKKLGYKSFGKIEMRDTDKEIGIWHCENILNKPIDIIEMPHPARKNHESYFGKLMECGKKILSDDRKSISK